MSLTSIYKNNTGQITQENFYAADGVTLIEIDQFSNGLMSKATHYGSDGKTIISVTTYNYVGKALSSTTTTAANGQITNVTNYAPGGSVSQINTYNYNANGQLASITETNESGAALQTITYIYPSANSKASGTSTSSPTALLQTATYSYNAKGQLTTVVTSNAAGTTIETDSYSYRGNNLSSVTKTNAQKQVIEIDSYGQNGAISQINTYSYSATGALSIENIANGLGQVIYSYTFIGNAVGSITYSQYDSLGHLAIAQKANQLGQIIEEDDYLLGNLSQIKLFNNQGVLTKATSYAADGVTIVQTQTNAINSNGQITASSITNVAGTLIEVDSYTYGFGGQLTQEVRKTAAGTIIETDKFAAPSLFQWFEGIQTESRYDSSGQLFEVDALQNGKVIDAQNYVNNLLVTDSQYQNGVLTKVTQYASDGKTIAEINDYINGFLASQSIYNSKGVLQTENLFAADGLTVTQTENFTYNANGSINQVFHSAGGQNFETDQYSYNSRGQLTQVQKTNASGVVTEIDLYNGNGSVNQITHPNTPISPVTPTKPSTPTTPSTPATPANTVWSSTSGWGESNVLSALDLVLGKTLTAVTAPKGTASDLQSMGFQNAWAQGDTGKGIVIADIDTGLDLMNSVLMSGISLYKNGAANYNFVANNSNVQDDNGHGTCTASELVAGPNVGNGVEGGAYGAQLMVLKALNAQGSGSDANIISAIDYAVNNGANVINMSLGGTTPDAQIEAAVQYASSHGVVVCMAAGNSGASTPDYPAAYAQSITDAIAVGASQVSGSTYSMASFSNQAGSTSAYNFIDALGVGIVGYGLNNTLYSWSGTSMATPLIAAEIADLESANTGLSSYQIVQDVMQAASTLGSGSGSSASSASGTSSQGISQLIQALGGMSPLGSGQINLSSLALHATSPSALVAAH